MDLGIFMMPVHHPARDYATVLEEDREAVILADELGFTEAWIGEHFTSKPEQITSPLIFLASLIDRTKQIRFASGVLNLPQMHPAVVAGYVAMFDQLAKGRYILGVGPGGLPSDFELFDRQEADRPAMMLEAIETMLAIWSQEPPYEIKGDYWDVSVADFVLPDIGVGFMAKPYQRPHPPIALSVMSPYSSSARLAGERGWIPISANFVPPAHVKTHWQAYAEGAEAAGREPDPGLWRVARSILVTDSDAEAEDYVADPEGALYFYFHYLSTLLKKAGGADLFKTDPDMSDDEVTPERAIRDMVIAGSPATVVAKLAALRDDIGPFGTLIMTGHDWDRPELWRRSMVLLKDEVLPKLSGG